MSGAGTVSGAPMRSERLPGSSQQSASFRRTTEQTQSLAATRQNSQIVPVIFTHPFEARTGTQIQPLYSTDRTGLGARTHALAYESDHRGRAYRLPSRSRRSLPAEAAGTRSRLVLRACVLDSGTQMTRSNRTHDANDPKTTAAPTPCSPVERETSNETGSDPQPARTNGRQVRISQFGFVPASQLRSDESNHEDGDQGANR